MIGIIIYFIFFKYFYFLFIKKKTLFSILNQTIFFL